MMKKFASFFLALIMILMVACPVMAEDVGFVPSITVKPAPSPIGLPEGCEEDVCLIITPVSQAKTTTKIPKEAAQLLLDVYEKMTKPGAKLSEICPELNTYVGNILGENRNADDLIVRDLFDIRAMCDELNGLFAAGKPLALTFDLGLSAETPIFAMTYINGAWKPLEGTKNNGDGTITCYVTASNPVAFLVPASTGADEPSDTGDSAGREMLLWSTVMVAALVCMIGLVVAYRRSAEKENG